MRPALGPLSLFALGLNGIVGVGIFVSPPTVAAAIPGGRGAVLYLAVALACMPVALVYARLARAMPRDGGPALYAERAFGPRAASAIGVLIWVSSVLSTAAVTRALADLGAGMLHRPGAVTLIAPLLVVALALVNLRGLRLSAVAWTVLTLLKLAPLIAIAGLGLVHARQVDTAPSQGSLGQAMLAILFALQGFEIVPLPAGQVRDPVRTVPRATVAALVVAGLLYAAIHFGCVVALPELATSKDPIAEAARVFGGSALGFAVRAGVVASVAGIVVGYHAMTPRYLSAVTAPEKSMGVDSRAIAISVVFVAPLAAVGSLGSLVDLSSAAVLAQYGATTCALIALAAYGREGLRVRDAWPAPLSLVVVAVLLSQARGIELAIAAGVALLGGAAVALFRARRA